MRLARWWCLSRLAVCRVLVIDGVVGLNQLEGYLVVEVLALPLHLQVRTSQELHRLATANAALLATSPYSGISAFISGSSAFCW
jgi:hypothetical protein